MLPISPHSRPGAFLASRLLTHLLVLLLLANTLIVPQAIPAVATAAPRSSDPTLVTPSSAPPIAHTTTSTAEPCPAADSATPAATRLLYLGAAAGTYGHPLTLAAQLTDASGMPLAGRSLAFQLGAQAATATTDANGLARVSGTPSGTPGPTTASVSFAGDAATAAAQITQTVAIAQQETALLYTGALPSTQPQQPVSVRLIDAETEQPIASAPLTFQLGRATATATTDASGSATATLTLSADQATDPAPLLIRFAGDIYRTPAQLSVPTSLTLPAAFGAAVVRHAPSLNGNARIEGNLRQLRGEDVALNGGAMITGDLLLPGSPMVRRTGNSVVGSQLQGSGSPQPSAYTLTLNGNAQIGRLITRTDPITLSAIAAPPTPIGTRDVALARPGASIGDPATLRNLTLMGQVRSVAVPPGTYGQFSATGDGVFVFGVAGTTQPVVYNLQGLTLNERGSLRVVGPVIVQLAHGATLNGQTGAEAQPRWLTLNVAAGDVTLNGGSTVSGILRAPSSRVVLNGQSRLRGALFADRLILNGGAVVEGLRVPDAGSAPALTVTQASPTQVLPGETFSTTLTVSNTTAVTATEVVARERFSGTTPVSATAQIGTIRPLDHTAAVFPEHASMRTLRQDEETTDAYLSRLAAADGQPLTARGILTFADAAGQTYAPLSTHSSTQLRLPWLVLGLSAPACVSPGTRIPYAVRIANLGRARATAATIQITFPDGSTGSLPLADLAPGAVITETLAWTVPAIPAKGRDESDAHYRDRLAALDETILSARATLAWQDAAGNRYGSVVQAVQTVERVPILTFAIQVPATLVSGQTVPLEITVDNVGGGNAQALVVQVANPDGTQSTATAPRLAAGQTVVLSTTWTVPAIAPRSDSESDADYQARLAAIDASAPTFGVALTWSDSAGSSYGPMSASQRSLQPLPIVEVGIAGPATATAGQTITYTVTLTNSGHAAATSTQLTLAMPDGSVQTPDAGGALAPGGRRDLVVAFTIPITSPAGLGVTRASVTWRDGGANVYGPLHAQHTSAIAEPPSDTPLNHPPTARGSELTLVEDSANWLALGALVADPDQDPLAFALRTLPEHGSATLVSDTLIYTPSLNFFGADRLVYAVSDGRGGSAEAEIRISVTPVNDPPDVFLTSDRSLGLAPQAITFSASASDPENDTLTYAWEFDDGTGASGTGPQTHTYRNPGVYTATLTVNDGQASARASQTIDVRMRPTDGPPDPALIAPPIDTTTPTDFASSVAFLYTGADPLQTGVVSGAIEVSRTAVLRGRITQRDDTALAGVTVSVKDHPEFGQTVSRADGMFDLVVNGGGLLTINYQKAGFLPAQRQVRVPERDYAWLPDVTLLSLDPLVTEVTLNSASAVQVARGSRVSDSDGARQATILFPAHTTATMVLSDGTQVPLASLHVRATEYTVGDNGPQAMPASLPPYSGYTYAAEFSVDEALAAGATTVNFSQPLPVYVENFIGFPVGMVVPAGYYDREKAAWIASDNGRVIKIVSITGGRANLDITGDGVADNAGVLGVTDAERQQLAALYQVGQVLWRVPIRHFTPWDCNWPYGPPGDAIDPNGDSPQNDNSPDCPNTARGSIISCESQTLGEVIEVAGTPFRLMYQSDRVPGRTTANTLEIPLSGTSVPASLRSMRLEVSIAGQQFTHNFVAGPNQTTIFSWDGFDAYGRSLQGQQPVVVRIGFVYGAVYQSPANFVQSFGRLGAGGGVTGNRSTAEVTAWKTWEGLLGTFDVQNQGIGGWMLDVHHTYDPSTNTLYLGDGTRRSAEDVGKAITTMAGGGGIPGDGGPATAASLSYPMDVAVGPDGSFYIADNSNHRIRRVAPDGTISTIAGNGEWGFSGDGGPATAAQLDSPAGLELSPDGSLYLADASNQRIRRVDTNGVITTPAGGGGPTPGDGAPGTAAPLNVPLDVVVGQDGSLYIADRDNHRIRRVAPDGTISTIAGTGEEGLSGDGGPATAARLSSPSSVALDAHGNLYIADSQNDRIRRVGIDGIITTFAGTGQSGFSGDGGPAVNAQLGSVQGIALATDGSLYIADSSNQRIRRIGTDGIITTVAGNGQPGFSGDGGLATQARLSHPSAAVADAAGNLYIADNDNNRIRRVALNGIITTFAGTGQAGFSGDGGAASAARISHPSDLLIGPDGSLSIVDMGNNRIRRISPSGIISTVVGSGYGSYEGDGGLATDATLNRPNGIALGPDGRLYIADTDNNRIRRVGTNGIILTVAGTGTAGYDGIGDGRAARDAVLAYPVNMALGPDGSLYIADEYDHRIRRVRPDGTIVTVAGSGTPGFAGDGEQATIAQLNDPSGVAVDAAGNLYIADRHNDRVRRVAPDGIITTIAGTDGDDGGDGGPASAAQLANPSDLEIGPDGSLYIADTGISRIRRISPGGIISTVAGNEEGPGSYAGDGRPATSAWLGDPNGIALGPDGRLYIADTGNHRIRRVGTNGIILTVAGTGASSYYALGDGRQATSAQLSDPWRTAASPDGSVYIVDTGQHRVRRVRPDGTIVTVAGNGSAGSLDDGELATVAQLNYPRAVAVGPDGSLYIADTYNNRIRRVRPDGIITTIAGTGERGFSGDGGPASAAQFNLPDDIAVGPDGSLYIADATRIRHVGPDGIITTIAGTGRFGFSGDGGPARAAQLSGPMGIALDTRGNLYIADEFNNRIRKVGANGIITTVAGTGQYGFSGDGGLATSARLAFPYDVDVGDDGTLYIADSDNSRIRRVLADGRITTIAGSGEGGFSGDGDLPIMAQIGYPTGVMVRAGKVYITDLGNDRIRLIDSALPGGGLGEISIPSADGRELYQFNAQGRHLRTRDALTGDVLLTFHYDTAGRLIGMTDRDGLTTTIERDTSGNPTAIMGPYRHRTTLRYDLNGYLASITTPAGETTQLSYTSGGLLTRMTDPRNGQHTFTYDALGRLTRDTNPVGGVSTLNRIDYTGGYTVTLTNALGDSTRYGMQTQPSGERRRVQIAPNGATTTTVIGVDQRQTLTLPNGIVATVVEAPDPRWGMQAPFVKSLTLSGADNRVFYTDLTTRTVTLSNPSNPLSLRTQTEQVTINGRTTTTVYDAATRTQTITNPAGEQTVIRLDASGRPIQTTVTNLTPTHYVYDTQGRLISTTEGVGQAARTTRRTYTSQGDLASVTDALSGTTTYRYDAVGRMLSEILPTGQVLTSTYDQAGNQTSHTDEQGVQTVYEYDLQNRMIAQTRDPVGRAVRTEYTYDRADNLLSQVEDAGSGRLNATTRYEYTPLLESQSYTISRETDALGQQTRYTYTPAGTISSITDPLNRTTTITYNPQGLPSEVISPSGQRTVTIFNDDGQPVRVVDPRGSVTTYTYDALGRLTRMTAGAASIGAAPALNQTTTYAYDVNGRITQITDPRGKTSILSYDAFGRRIGERDPLGTTTTYGYDALDRLIRQVEGANVPGEARTVVYTYDASGRQLTEQLDPDGQNLTTRYHYTQPGSSDTWNPQAVEDPKGQITRYRYNTLGLLAATTDATGHIWSYTYDNLGRLIGQADPLNHTTGYAYDAIGQQLGETVDGRTRSWSYDADGNLASATDFMSRTTRYAYDPEQRLTGIDYPDGTADVSYRYDAAGNLVAMDDGLGTTTYTYDVLDRLRERTRSGRTVGYDYNLNDQITRIGYWGQGDVAYAYDDASRLTNLTPWSASATSYTWRADGQLAGQTRGNGVTTRYSYDSANRLLELLHQRGGTTLEQITYLLDANSNRIRMRDSAGETLYTYDALDQLTQVSYPAINGGPAASSVAYTYDPVGNRLTEMTTSPTRTLRFSYDAGDRIINPGYRYDANGNLLNDGTTTYEYDAADRLIKTVQDGVTTTYGYDGHGDLIRQATGGITSELMLDESGELTMALGEVRSDGSELRYAYGPKGVTAQQQLGGAAPQGVTYPLLDGLGSVRHLTDANGAIIRSLHYDVFGAIRHSRGTAETTLGFAGERWSDDGTIYLRARHYRPALGRFLQRDDFPGFATRPASLNRYTYTENNPVNYVDPSGHLLFLLVPIISFALDAYGAYVIGKGIGRVIKDNVINGCHNLGENVGSLARNAIPVSKLLRAGKRLFRPLTRPAKDLFRRAKDLMGKCANSFSADTDVWTAEGAKDISVIKVGDLVWAWDEATGATGLYTVTDVIVHLDHGFLTLTIDGEWLETTYEHPFYVEGRGWVKVGDLRIGDRVRKSDGSFGLVEAIEVEQRPQVMYNLTVAIAHTFFVGDGEWLVHNSCPYDRPPTGKRPSDYRKGVTDEVRAKNDGKCVYCGEPATTNDHIVSWKEIKQGATSRGDELDRYNNVTNMDPACLPCNSSKGAEEVSIWLSRGGRRGTR